MKNLALISLLFFVSLRITSAEANQFEVQASNGVKVSVTEDSFSNEKILRSPVVSFVGTKQARGAAFVTHTNKANNLVTVVGVVSYFGDWQFYESAVYKGGESVDFRLVDKKVKNCQGGTCTLQETFMATIPEEKLKKYASNGEISIQISSRTKGDKFIVTIPTAHFEAVREIANR